MYVFNWHANERIRRDLLTRIGDSQTLKRTDKVFAAVHRLVAPHDGKWGGADLHDRILGETPVTLYRTLTDEGPSFHVSIHDHVVQEAKAGRLKSVDLRIELQKFSPADRVQVILDGKTLGEPAVRTAAREGAHKPSDVSQNSWLVWPLDPHKAEQGAHEVQIRLLKRDPRIKPPLVVQSVEFHVSYTSGGSS